MTDKPVPVLLLGVDSATLKEISTRLHGLDAVAVNCTEGGFEDGVQLARAHAADVVMIVMDGDPRRAFALMEELNRTLPASQIFALSHLDTTENIVKAMRAGAAEFLGLPIDASQVVKALVKASALRRLTQPNVPAGQLWTLYGTKGGAGTTLTAANLALEVHASTGTSVCLVDLDFQSGDLALVLNLTPVYTLVDIALNFRRLDSVFLQGTLTRHPSGIYLLAAPPHGSVDAASIPADHIRSVLDLLKSMYDVVIVDTSRALSEETVAALWSATRLLLLLELSLPSLRGYRRTLDVLDAVGVPRDRLQVVISKYGNSKGAVPLDEAKKSLELTDTHLLPFEPETALEALNKGLGLAEVKRNSPLRQSIAQLGQSLLAGNSAAEKEPKKRKGIWGGLFS